MGSNVKVKIDLSGLNKLKKKLNEVEGPHNYQMSEVFPNQFMERNTKFSSIDSFFNAVGVYNENDMIALDDTKLDEFVRENSEFLNWNEMKLAASTELLKQKLDLD